MEGKQRNYRTKRSIKRDTIFNRGDRVPFFFFSLCFFVLPRGSNTIDPPSSTRDSSSLSRPIFPLPFSFVRSRVAELDMVVLNIRSFGREGDNCEARGWDASQETRDRVALICGGLLL